MVKTSKSFHNVDGHILWQYLFTGIKIFVLVTLAIFEIGHYRRHLFFTHIVFIFSYVNFIEIILNHLTIMKFNSILPDVSYLNAGWVWLYYIDIIKDKKQENCKRFISLSLSLSLWKKDSYIYIRLLTLYNFLQIIDINQFFEYSSF